MKSPGSLDRDRHILVGNEQETDIFSVKCKMLQHFRCYLSSLMKLPVLNIYKCHDTELMHMGNILKSYMWIKRTSCMQNMNSLFSDLTISFHISV